MSKRVMDRRGILKLGATGVALAALPACTKHETKPTPSASSSAPVVGSASSSSVVVVPPADANVVRVGSVPTAVEGNVLPTLMKAFEEKTKRRVVLSPSEGVYDLAREGKLDLVVSHFGHRDAETFVMDGFGEFPRTIFSNQMAMLGPPSDPAKIRGLTDAGEAFSRIAKTKSPFVLNGIDGVRYLVEILWNAAGRPSKEGWLIDDGLRKDDAVNVAAERGAYVFWGLTPFLRSESAARHLLEPLVVADPLLQRMLVSIVVKPKVAGVNVEGAHDVQSFLLSPVTQAQIRQVRYPGAEPIAWVPAGRHNRTAVLPKT